MNTKLIRYAKSMMLVLPLGVATVLSTASCTTSYDQHGRPAQTVDPGVAIAGAAAAGVLGYAIANNRDNRRHRAHYPHGHYYQPTYRHGGRYYR